MTEQKNYALVLIESLQKKLRVLDDIILKNQEQTEIVKQEQFDMDAFDANVSQKSELIAQLEQLDTGFEAVYERLRTELLQNKAAYAEEIRSLQTLIAAITDRSVAIQAAEVRNRQMIEKHFSYARQEIQKARTTTKAASNYYKAVSQFNKAEPQMMDEKK